MTSRTVSLATIWAVLAMEAGLALPLISVPTQGDRLPGLLGPLLLVALLPLGYLAVADVSALRDPSWRLLCGIGAALATRAVVGTIAEPDLAGLLLWLGHSVVPAAIGVGLWWRGGALAVAELTPADVRTEFIVLASCLTLALVTVRPFLLADPVLLGASVALFAAGGLVGTALSRQDAAEAGARRSGRMLAAATALLPLLAATVLVALLRPSVVGSLWSALAGVVELLLTPVGWFLNWLAALFPPVAPGPPATPPQLNRLPPVDPAALAELQDRMGWVGTVVLVALILTAGVAALLVVRLLLANWIRLPTRRKASDAQADVRVERSGTLGQDAHAALGWLRRWLRGVLGRSPRPGRLGAEPSAQVGAADARAAYRRLLEWAAHQGLARRPAETTGQLQDRLARHAPGAAVDVELVTTTYEWERYGAVRPAADRLQRVQAALRALFDR